MPLPGIEGDINKKRHTSSTSNGKKVVFFGRIFTKVQI